MEIMIEALLDAGKDSLVILPFLFIIYFLLELFAHKYSHKTLDLKRFGPLVGSAAGLLPQCGFSLAATALFNKRAISIGTLIAVYLSTSDEAIPILLAHPDFFSAATKIIALKFAIGLAAGMIVDLFIRKREADDCYCHDCDEKNEEHSDHHHESGLSEILRHSLRKTMQIFIFLAITMFLLTWIILIIGEDRLALLLSSGSIFQPLLCALFGLIPTCVPSILITQLFIAEILPFGSMMAGLCASSGMGIILLFKENKEPKQIITVLLLLYSISCLVGISLNFSVILN